MVAMNPASPGTIETWHNVTLSNGWSNQGSGNAPLRYRLLPGGNVQWQGVFVGTNATSSTIGTIPSGWFDTTYQGQLTASNTGASTSAYFQVSTSGVLTMNGYTALSGVWIVSGILPGANQG
jgi:hypothetical protein